MIIDTVKKDVDYSNLNELFNEKVEDHVEQEAVSNVANSIVNIALLVVNLQRQVEDRQDGKIGDKLGEIEALHSKINKITTFLEHLEEKLGHEGEKTIKFSEHQQLVKELNEQFPHELLNKTEWTRAEGEALSKAFGRRIEQVSRLINPKMVDVNHLMEDRHEMLSLVRELLKMWREMLQGMTRNQKGQ